jgi:FAD:protein FMN transferase
MLTQSREHGTRANFLGFNRLASCSQSLEFHMMLAPHYSLLRATRRAMATTFEIAIPAGTPGALDAAHAALDLIDELEDELSIYRPDGAVSKLNAAGAGNVGERLLLLLKLSAQYSLETRSAFDPAAGALVRAWGFQARKPAVPEPAAINAALAASGMKHVLIHDNHIKFLRPGLMLNFGSVGKGFALDCAAKLIVDQFGIRSALLHGGGSSVVAIGTPPGDSAGWPVAVRHPHNPHRTLGTVRLIDQSLGTSAATFQFFEYDGKRYGHVLDPRTGRPAEGTASASAVAPSGAAADAYSTAFFVFGHAAAAEFVRSRPELGAVVLPSDARSPGVAGAVRYEKPTAREVFTNTLSYWD